MPVGEVDGSPKDVQLVREQGRPVAFRAALAQPDRIRISLDFGTPGLECLPCEELLLWDPSVDRWVCRSCGYRVSPDEAIVLARRAMSGLKSLVADAKKRGKGQQSWLRRLFGRNRPPL